MTVSIPTFLVYLTSARLSYLTFALQKATGLSPTLDPLGPGREALDMPYTVAPSLPYPEYRKLCARN